MNPTRVSQLLRIDYPIIQGGMLWLADAKLAAAVSNAGGLGVISPNAGMKKHGDSAENLRDQIREVRKLTERPFGVNIPLDLNVSGILIDILLQKKVKVVITAAGDPSLYTELLLHEGVIVLHVVSSVKQALTAESHGVKAVVAAGVEAAAHIGFDEIPLSSLIPQIVDAVTIPVIAAGGIADGRGIAAALALGAEGVQLGTRFVATDECMAHINYKQALLDAKDSDTIITSRQLLPTRSLKTPFSKRLFDLDRTGASGEEIYNFLGYSRARRGQIEGDFHEGEAYAGASVGLIKEVLPAAQVIQKLVDGYEKVVRGLIEE